MVGPSVSRRLENEFQNGIISKRKNSNLATFDLFLKVIVLLVSNSWINHTVLSMFSMFLNDKIDIDNKDVF